MKPLPRLLHVMLPIVIACTVSALASSFMPLPSTISVPVRECRVWPSGGPGPNSPSAHPASSSKPLLPWRCIPRGGATRAASPPFDLSRELIRLEGLNAYRVVTAIIMTSALELFSKTKIDWGDKDTVEERVLPTAFELLVTTCVVSGAYTVVMFSLEGIYAKTALGMGNDGMYMSFMEMLVGYRAMGFKCFLASLFSFLGSFLLSIYLKTGGVPRALICSLATFLMVPLVRHVRQIVNIATRLLFLVNS